MAKKLWCPDQHEFFLISKNRFKTSLRLELKRTHQHQVKTPILKNLFQPLMFSWIRLALDAFKGLDQKKGSLCNN